MSAKTIGRVVLGGAVLVLVLLLGPAPVEAGFCQCCGSSPLILDLGNNGLVSTVGTSFGVDFDLDSDGETERLGWTYWRTPEGILWMDLNGNRQVDNGRELFGNASLLPNGQVAEHGFEALAVFDLRQHGGDGDGWITSSDGVWRDLSIWIDWSHEGVSQAEEIYSLEELGVVAIGLEYTEAKRLDGAGNDHRLKGSFLMEVDILGEKVLRRQLIEDVFFARE